MATRPLAFGLRFHHQGRTLRIRGAHGSERGFAVEDAHPRRAVRLRHHGSLGSALRDFAAAWRSRLH